MDSYSVIDRASYGRAPAPSWRRVGTAATIILLLVALLGACGSSSKPTLSSAQVKRQTCKHLEAVLSDGPEPEADPVGYAQAQILPLRQIHASNVKLAGAITGLASAYQELYSSNGSKHAKEAVSAATGTLERLCPGIEL